MNKKTAISVDVATVRLALSPCTGRYQPPPWTTAERLQRIAALARQINTYVDYVCESQPQKGISIEARDRSIADFYDTMISVERELARIHQEFKLA